MVAEEVRRLAERSATSARNITGLIRDIQQQTAQAVQAMEVGTAEVDLGSRLAAEAGTALGQILEVAAGAAQELKSIAELTGQVRQRAGSVVEVFNSLAAGTEQVTAAVQRIAAIAQDSATATRGVSTSIDSLNASAAAVAESAGALAETARQLESQVARFRM